MEGHTFAENFNIIEKKVDFSLFVEKQYIFSQQITIFSTFQLIIEREVFLDRSRASRITIYIPVAKKVVKSDDKKKYID